MERFVSFVGIFVLLGLAYVFSSNRKAISFRVVIWGILLQLIFAVLILGVSGLGIPAVLRPVFDIANLAFIRLLDFTLEGSKFLFGDFMDLSKFPFIFALQVLPTIIFFSSLMAIAYHLGVMQRIVAGIAWVMQKALKTSGAETLSAAANIFVGQTEAPLLIRPYISKMTRSELMVVMVGGMATVAGGVLAAYMGMLKDRLPDIAGHLMTASVMSAPAALAIAKIMLPETEEPQTLGTVKLEVEKIDSNVIEAAARGAGDGLTLAFNVGAMLLAFIAIIAMVNWFLGLVGVWIGFNSWGVSMVPEIFHTEQGVALSLQVILGWIFSPLAFLMGVPWDEAAVVGTLLGEKIVINEFWAYAHLSQIMDSLSDRSLIISSYALCGFANFSSIAIQIGGIGGIAPERKSDLAKLGIRAVIGGSLAAFLTATIAGILI